MLILPKKNNFRLVYFLDLVVISFILYFLIKLQYQYFYSVKLVELPNLTAIFKAHYKAYFLIIISWFVCANYLGLYKLKRFEFLFDYLKKICFQTAIFSVIVFTISGLKSDELFANKLLIVFTISIFLYLNVTRGLKFYITKRRYSKGEDLKNALIIGENTNSKRLIEILNSNKFFGLKIVESVNDLNTELDILIDKINTHHVKYVFLVQSDSLKQPKEIKLLNYCHDNQIIVSYIPYSFKSKYINFDVNYIDTLPIYSTKNYPLEEVNNQLIKKSFDFIFSLLVCIFILSWLFLILGLLIKIDSKGEIIFIQKRRGLNGEIFNCYKFRTMYHDGTNSIQSTIVNDKRITRIGRFLRKSSLDEFPQFINVLKGEMSIVGPRPHMISQDTYYSEIIHKYNIRNYVKPGITGLAQIKGFRGAISINKDMEDRIRADIFYVRNWSIFLDLQIIYQTLILMFKGDKNAI